MTNFLKMKATDDVAELYIYGDIVSSEWDKFSPEDRCPQEIVDFLKGLHGQDLEIHINSCGGDVFGGVAIYNTIKNYKGYKVCYIDGLAASIASVIALSADEVVMLSGAQFMIHKPWSMVCGDANEMRKTALLLDGIQEQILNIYTDWSNAPAELLNVMIDNETWMNGEEAAEVFGFKLEGLKACACAETDLLSRFKNAPKLEFEDKTEEEPEKAEPMVEDETNQLFKQKLQLEIDLYKNL